MSIMGTGAGYTLGRSSLRTPVEPKLIQAVVRFTPDRAGDSGSNSV
jgi:hypothetical protein